MWKCGNAFSRVIQKYTKFAIFTLLYFRHFTIFYNSSIIKADQPPFLGGRGGRTHIEGVHPH